MNGERSFVSPDGVRWIVTLEAPGRLLQVAPEFENVGAMLPEEAIRIVFRSGDQQLSEEYTALTPLESMDEGDLRDWWEAARRGKGL